MHEALTKREHIFAQVPHTAGGLDAILDCCKSRPPGDPAHDDPHYTIYDRLRAVSPILNVDSII